MLFFTSLKVGISPFEVDAVSGSSIPDFLSKDNLVRSSSSDIIGTAMSVPGILAYLENHRLECIVDKTVAGHSQRN